MEMYRSRLLRNRQVTCLGSWFSSRMYRLNMCCSNLPSIDLRLRKSFFLCPERWVLLFLVGVWVGSVCEVMIKGNRCEQCVLAADLSYSHYSTSLPVDWPLTMESIFSLKRKININKLRFLRMFSLGWCGVGLFREACAP